MSGVTPDRTIAVFSSDYLAALATDAQRWPDSVSSSPVWAGRPVFRLAKGTEEKTMWRVISYAHEREYITRERSAMVSRVANLVAGASFRSLDAMVALACERLVQEFGSALTEDEHRFAVDACADLWQVAVVSQIATYEATTLGRAALLECVDCFKPATPGGLMCAECRARHVTPDRSELRESVS